MGAVHVTVTIRNPAEPSRSWEGLFLVDTGATDSLAPRSHLEAIGLESKGLRVYETADGRKVKMDVTTADIEFMGDFTAGRIIMGDDDAEPLLGVTALESAGIEVDPVNKRLKKLPALRLYAAAGNRIGGAWPRIAGFAQRNRGAVADLHTGRSCLHRPRSGSGCDRDRTGRGRVLPVRAVHRALVPLQAPAPALAGEDDRCFPPGRRTARRYRSRGRRPALTPRPVIDPRPCFRPPGPR